MHQEEGVAGAKGYLVGMSCALCSNGRETQGEGRREWGWGLRALIKSFCFI